MFKGRRRFRGDEKWDILGHLQNRGFDYPYILQTLYIKKGRSDTPLT